MIYNVKKLNKILYALKIFKLKIEVSHKYSIEFGNIFDKLQTCLSFKGKFIAIRVPKKTKGTNKLFQLIM
jgi:hypothetical protein